MKVTDIIEATRILPTGTTQLLESGMSIFVDSNGHPTNYVVVNATRKVIIAGFGTINSAVKARNAQQARDGDDDYVIYNITQSSKCPKWIMDYVFADRTYCAAQVKLLTNQVNEYRRKAATILSDADQIQAIADRWTSRLS